ncbi:MAG: D-alanyl-D-alanine carboxypeptidase family protein [Pirellulaceae bacterium]
MLWEPRWADGNSQCTNPAGGVPAGERHFVPNTRLSRQSGAVRLVAALVLLAGGPSLHSEPLSKEPEEDLAAPPLVTCKAWAVADGKTGNILFSSNADRTLDIASTTKIMTAYVVLTLAESDSQVLDEVVVFSERADGTIGSTAGVRTGERVSVRELLFGLLLPSGNDASVALAEQFGDRFPLPAGEKDADPLVRFVAQMNRTAKSLGMNNTTYRNPHGLTDPGHASTARDLITLTHAALRLGSFRHYVSTRQHGCALLGPGGCKRNVVWKNTNRLLAREGYIGVKTGTTSAAGACLVSAGERGDDTLIVVVLGSAVSQARYTDSRNLFRWAWRQRGDGKSSAGSP